jgi:hypothetical protein
MLAPGSFGLGQLNIGSRKEGKDDGTSGTMKILPHRIRSDFLRTIPLSSRYFWEHQYQPRAGSGPKELPMLI